MAHSEALEKRLRAVYDAFDQRNHKAAIKLCNAGLQKYPDCHTFRALKAVALERSGKRDEALQMADEVLEAAPADDHCLNMLLLVLKPANRTADLTAAYEAACNKQPNSEDLLEGLFGCHVRSFSYTAQQQVAVKLNKLHPNELYQWWVVASLALQAHTAAVQARLEPPAPASTSNGQSSAAATPAAGGSGAGLGADKLLALAEAMAGRLLNKAPAQGGQHSWESVMMYLGLLQAQGKFDAALAAVRGPLGASFSLTAERREAEAAILLAKGDLQAAAALYQQALQEQPDDWAVLLLYLDCVLPATASTLPACCSTGVAQMMTGVEASTRPGCQTGGLAALMAAMKAGADSQPPVQDRVSQAEAFISSLGSTPNSGSNAGSVIQSTSVLRGPALAHVELAKRKVQLGLADELQLVEAMLQYHDRFGHVVSCAMDVFCYLEHLGSASRQQLSSALAQRAEQAAAEFQKQQQEAGAQQSSNKLLLKLLRRHMSSLQIQADIGAPRFSNPAAAAQHAQHLMQLYAAALPLNQGLDERERGPADELLWQAAAALVAAATMQHSNSNASSSSPDCIKHLLSAVLVLEAAAKGRPYCAPVRLGLAGLYGLLGNAAAAAHHLYVLDVKHVQHDTLSSHHLLPLLLGLKAPRQTEALLKPMCALFEDHLVDAGDTLMQAYRNGTHTKVLEFVCFKERLERSHTFALARAERAIQSISTAAAAAAHPDGVTAAVAAALQALRLDHLDSITWRGMRFNDDLTTRLPWLPPIQGPRQLLVLTWWEQQQQQQQLGQTDSSSSSSSSAACWWRQVAAAEAGNPAAAALRDSMKAAAQARWLLPHLLGAALDTASTSTSSNNFDAAHTQLPQLLTRLAVAQGYSSIAELVAAVEQAFGPGGQAAGSSCGAMLSKQLQLLDAAVFILACSLQELLVAQHCKAANGHAASSAGMVPAVSQCVSSLSAALAQLQQYFQQRLQPAAAYKGCVLPGDVLSAAALLLSESCCWLDVCLESWCKALKGGKKKKGGKAASTEQPRPHVDQATEQLSLLQQALQALLHELQCGADRMLQQPIDAAVGAVLAEFDESSDAAVQALVGWEHHVSVQLVLTELVKQQRVLLGDVRDGSSRMQKQLQGLSW